ncbi:MAG: hypothetical protein P4L85_17150 [Paludisphaera borealis]|uniref:hypothetical protein n=1 Tax=Paludisphaera borealis TaxID=1387353 RepID=UPI00284AA100|nr:hypothetical protein [Paludisphaera borealis]MDR3621082.1 hypothetical protein [Paludisphaera borealis]
MVTLRELEKPVARVFRRLRFQRFVTAGVWSWTGALLVVAVVLGVFKVLNRPLPCAEWVPFAVAAGVGVVIAALVAVFSGPSRLDAAVAVDRAYKLNERISTALTLPDDLRESPAGRALIADAIRKLEQVDVTSAFGPRLPRRAWVMAIPAALAVAILFVPSWVTSTVQARTTAKLDPAAIAKKSEALTKKIASQREKIDKEKFPEAEKLLAQIEKKSEELGKAPPSQKDKLLVEMNKLSDALKDRQKQLGSPEQVSKQLQQLKEMGEKGPADQLAKELTRGDFKKAAEQIKELQEKMKADKLTPNEKKALKEQLGEMAKKLNDLANMDQRKKQLDEALKNGGLSKEQHEREMEKLKQQAKQLKQLEQLAGKLGEAQKALKKGDAKKAAEALGMSEKQVADMAKQLEEMEALDGAMADVMDAKDGMNMDAMNQLGDSMGGMGPGSDRRGNSNNGGSRGRGAGDRAEAADKTSLYTTKVQQQIRKGKAIFQGFTDPSKTIKGESKIDIQGELEAATGSAADALSNQRIPKSVEKHIRSYYDQLNKGK